MKTNDAIEQSPKSKISLLIKFQVVIAIMAITVTIAILLQIGPLIEKKSDLEKQISNSEAKLDSTDKELEVLLIKLDSISILIEDKKYELAKKTAEKSVTKFQKASKSERDGFTALLEGRYDDSIAAFEEAERIYPAYHQVYEIGRLLREERNNLTEPEKRKQVFHKIVNKYSWKAPKEMLEKLRELSK